MPKLPPAERLPRAREMAQHALDELGSRDPARIQNAAGKGWIAARLAAQALVLCRKGRNVRGTTGLIDAVHDLVKERPSDVGLATFKGVLLDAYGELHLKCGEQGECSTRTPRVIRDVAEDLLPLASRLCRSR